MSGSIAGAVGLGKKIESCPDDLSFWAKDIVAARAELVARGAKISKIMVRAGLVRCEGKDPDGNPFSLSDRE